MTLRDEIKNDPRAMEMPMEFLRRVEKFSAEDWDKLLSALRRRDKETAARLFGITPQQADKAFEEVMERAKEVAKAHPDILDLTKGR